MGKPVTTIVTIADMIQKKDWQPLLEKSEVNYIETDKAKNEEEILDLIKDSDYLMIDPDAVEELKESFYRKVVERKLPLKAISADITGMSWASPDAALKHKITLMNTAGYSTVSVAEFVIALLLVQVKRLNLVYLDRLKGNEEHVYQNDVLYGKTVGIVGLGNIGKRIAELLQSFNVNIIGWDRNDKKLPNVKQLSLEKVLAQSDYLSINLKTTDETKGIFDGKLLSHAKKGLFVINEADGPLVDNNAMLSAINEGRIEGYACRNGDVAGSKLEGHEKVIKFPPQAWFTEHSLDLLRKIWVANIISAIDGNPQNLVN